MERKEVLVVFLLGLLVAAAASVRLFRGSMLASSDTRTKGPPRRPQPSAAPNKDAEFAGWPPVDPQLLPRNPAPLRLLEAAETAYTEGLFDAAARLYQRFVEKFPSEPIAEMALLRTGQCCTLAQHYRDAADHYEQFLDDYPVSKYRPLALLWSAESHLQLRNPDAARRRLTEVVERYPDSPFAERARQRLARLDGKAALTSRATAP